MSEDRKDTYSSHGIELINVELRPTCCSLVFFLVLKRQKREKKWYTTRYTQWSQKHLTSRASRQWPAQTIRRHGDVRYLSFHVGFRSPDCPFDQSGIPDAISIDSAEVRIRYDKGRVFRTRKQGEMKWELSHTQLWCCCLLSGEQ